MSEQFRGKLNTPQDVATYVQGGRGKITAVSLKSGQRITYKFRIPQNPRPGCPIFVMVKKEQAFTFLGCIFKNPTGYTYRHGRKSPIHEKDITSLAIKWILARAFAGKDLNNLEVYHEGTCCRCGRSLTDPQSITTGIGPVCSGRQHKAA